MGKTFILIIAIFLFSSFGKREIPTLFMIGDSTMANKPLEDNPERGWGQLLPTFFDTTQLKIENHAKNGRSTRSFIYEGRWDSVYAKLRPGNFVVIQFGHNDGVIEKTGRYSTPEEFRYNLSKFVRETRQKRAVPILCTPIVRRNFDEKGIFHDTHGIYPDIVRKVADSLSVPLIDMHHESEKLVTSLGDESSKELYLHINPGIYKSLPDGRKDDTHFSEKGAVTMASFFVEGIKKQHLELAKYLKNE
jgi:DNA sulfur modification protein DndE